MKVLPPLGAETIQQATKGISEVEQEAVSRILDQIVHNLL